MKLLIHAKTLIPTLLLMFILSACGAGTATPTEETSLEGIYTSAAMTLSAQLPAATPTLHILSTTISAPTATLISMSSATPSLSAGAFSLGNSNSCDNAVYLSDVTIPDGTVLTPGESFTKSWNLQNTGTCTWTTSYSIAYYSGNSMAGATTALSDSVSPNGNIDVSIELAAPATAGTYTGYWRLQNASSISFGEAVYVQIVVAESTATVTSTPTPTDEIDTYTSTPTTISTSTATPIPTETTVPTNTFEPTATETPSS